MKTLASNAVTVLERRYLSKDKNGKPTETIEEMFRRVAKHVAGADALFGEDSGAKSEEIFFELMTELKFMPNSPTLMNAGKPLGQLSACFVLPVGDSMEEIFDAVKNAALIHKSGGGTGFSFSRLRPVGASVRSTGGVASGPVSFMKVFNAATEAVKQGGTRRGANMGILRIDHPNILDFIQCKKSNSDITNFNISVGLSEKFMEAVQNGTQYELINPHTKKPCGKLDAGEVFELIVDMAHNNGEPGIVFLDRMNADNPTPKLGEIESTNPCGEQPLLPYESCNLGSINLSLMIKDGKVDYDELGRVVDSAVHFLDNVIEVNKYPLDEIAETTLKTRKIGLGVMGFADMLFELNVPYNSEEGIALAREVMGFINERAHEASSKLAQRRGSFPAFAGSKFEKEGRPMRNATCTTIAPTGTISIICGASSGVEPLFALSFVRNVMDDDELPEVYPPFKEIATREGFYSPELMRRIAKEGTIAHIDEVPEHIKKVFVTAHDISPEYHIRMQAAFQTHTDNAVSKTVNFPNEATREDVSNVYMMAFELGCKGVTIYRDGSRAEQVLYVGDSVKDAKGESSAQAQKVTPRPRPDVTRGITEKVKIGCGNLYITVNYDDKGICEVFTNLGRAGGCPSQSEATSRLVSTALRSGMDINAVIEQLRGIRCHSTLRQRNNNKDIKVLSCPDAIGRMLEKVTKLREAENGNGALVSADYSSMDIGDAKPLKDACLSNCSLCSMKETCSIYPHTDGEREGKKAKCPECEGMLEHEGGCLICRSCGYSKCG